MIISKDHIVHFQQQQKKTLCHGLSSLYTITCDHDFQIMMWISLSHGVQATYNYHGTSYFIYHIWHVLIGPKYATSKNPKNSVENRIKSLLLGATP